MEEHLYEKTERDGYTLKIYYDIDARNPFEDHDTPTRFVLDTPAYDFGSRHETLEQATGYDTCDFNGRWDDALGKRVERRFTASAIAGRYLRLKWAGTKYRPLAFVPLDFIDYGGATNPSVRTSSYSDHPEFAYIDRYDFDKLVGSSPGHYESDEAHAKEIIEADIGEFKKYLEGEVFGYVVEDPDGEHLDSCWGLYGREYAEEEAGRAFEEAIRADKRERWEAMSLDPASPDYGLARR